MKVLLGSLFLGELSELTMWLGVLLTSVHGLNRGTYKEIPYFKWHRLDAQ